MFYGKGPLEQEAVLFIHIPKTAGTSIFQALLKSCRGTRGGLDAYRMGQKKHASALTARQLLTPKQWTTAFKFTVVRNPWDRMVSMWRYGQRQTRLKGGVRVLHTLNVPNPDDIAQQILNEPFPWWIHEFCRRYRWFPAHNHQNQPPYIQGSDGLRSDPPPQTAWFADAAYAGSLGLVETKHFGASILDKVYRFENLASADPGLSELETDMANILGGPFKLPHLNATEPTPYAPHYDAETRDWVARVFASDIQRYGYKFDDP